MITPEQADEFNNIVLKAAKKLGFQTVIYAVTEKTNDESSPIDGTTVVAVATREIDKNELVGMLASICEHIDENFLNPQEAEAEA